MRLSEGFSCEMPCPFGRDDGTCERKPVTRFRRPRVYEGTTAMQASLVMPGAAIPMDDERAFERALAAGGSSAMALACRMLGNPEDAREAVQEAWYRAWRHRRSLRDPAAVDGWVRAILVRECLRALRWRALRSWFGSSGAEEEATDLAHPGPGPEREAAAREIARSVRAAVAALPPRQRLVWGLRFDEGWSVPEIARGSGLAEDTVKTHLRRAGASIRAAVEPGRNEEDSHEV